jgi:hypothetical protein
MMPEVIELSLDSADGIIDCMLELQKDRNDIYYNVTILYPQVVNGYGRSEIFCHDMKRNSQGEYYFEEGEKGLHPKIKKLESRLSDEIISRSEK